MPFTQQFRGSTPPWLEQQPCTDCEHAVGVVGGVVGGTVPSASSALSLHAHPGATRHVRLPSIQPSPQALPVVQTGHAPPQLAGQTGQTPLTAGGIGGVGDVGASVAAPACGPGVPCSSSLPSFAQLARRSRAQRSPSSSSHGCRLPVVYLQLAGNSAAPQNRVKCSPITPL